MIFMPNIRFGIALTHIFFKKIYLSMIPMIFSKVKNCNTIYYNQFIKKTASFIVMVYIMIFIPNTRFDIVLTSKKNYI